MHQHRGVARKHMIGGGPRPGWFRRRLEHIANRAREPTSRGTGTLDERFQLEPQQPPAERIRLGDEDVRCMLLERREQHVPPGGAPGISDPATVSVHKHPEARVLRAGGGERDDAHAMGIDLRHPHSTGHEGDVRPALGEGTGDGGGAAPMADPQQVLDPDHDARRSISGSHRRLSGAIEGGRTSMTADPPGRSWARKINPGAVSEALIGECPPGSIRPEAEFARRIGR